MNLRNIFAVVILACLTACTSFTSEEEEPDVQEELVLKVRNSDRLYTTEYVVHKIVTYDDIVRLSGSVFNKKFNLALPQGSRKVLIPMEARVKAYIDFSNFGSENVEIMPDSTITVTLPDPVVLLTSTKIDHAGIRKFVDFGRSNFTSAELAGYEEQGRAAILEAIPSMGIEETAREHAYQFMRPLIESMGYPADKITVNFRKNFTESDYLNQLIQTRPD